MVSDDEVLARFPRVRIDADNVEHYRGLLESTLMINRCTECRAWHHPPRPVCPRCWSRSVTAEPVSGQGEIAIVTFLHQGPRGVDYTGGRAVAAVDLVEQPGLRVSAAVVDTDRDRIVVGAPVELRWEERDGEPVPVFAVVGAPAGADGAAPYGGRRPTGTAG